MDIFLGLMIPFIGTTFGAACVFFMKKQLNPLAQKCFLGFAAGVMVAASVWSLLIPAMDMNEEMGKLAFFPAVVGFLAGIGFLIFMDRIASHLYPDLEGREDTNSSRKNTAMLVFAVTLHNIPEGLSAGAAFAGSLSGNEALTMAGAFALVAGIAVQNFPEGAIISMPLRGNGMSRRKAFFYGTASGTVEPLAGALTLLLVHCITKVLPYLLAFAAGAMIFVAVEELIPEAREGEHQNIGTLTFAAGFTVMMILDVVLG